MRIITGTLRGRKIPVPKSSGVRPTSDRTKEGIFSIIDSRRYIQGAQVLDLFAGSGNLGFEAISRGAANVLFVDRDKGNIKTIEKTAHIFEIEEQIRTHVGPVEKYLDTPAIPFDFIFCDPPYDLPELPDLVEKILQNGWLAEGGWLVLEHDRRHEFRDHPHCLISRPYGRTIAAIFEAHPVEKEEE